MPERRIGSQERKFIYNFWVPDNIFQEPTHLTKTFAQLHSLSGSPQKFSQLPVLFGCPESGVNCLNNVMFPGNQLFSEQPFCCCCRVKAKKQAESLRVCCFSSSVEVIYFGGGVSKSLHVTKTVAIFDKETRTMVSLQETNCCVRVGHDFTLHYSFRGCSLLDAVVPFAVSAQVPGPAAFQAYPGQFSFAQSNMSALV